MEIILRIEQYLKGGLSYKEGVSIYNDHGNNVALKSLFSSGEDSYSRKKLLAELKRILDNNKPAEELSFVSFSPSKKKGSINVGLLSPELKTEFYKASGYIREIAAINPTLVHLKTEEARRESAARIVYLARLRREIFFRCDNYLATGKDPGIKALAAKVKAVNPSMGYYEAKDQLKLLRSQRSKLKNNTIRQADFESVCNRIIQLEAIINQQKIN